MRQRVFGTEHEYAVILDVNNPQINRDEALAAKLTALLQEADGRHGVLGTIKSVPSGRLWLPNGGCTYIDCGKPEFATPECARVKDLVAHDKAGEQIVYDIWGTPKANGDRIIIVKNTVSRSRDPGNTTKYVSYGAHENYMTYGLEPNAPELLRPLFPFFVTRLMLDGSGWWENPEEDVFHLSQRARFIQSEESRTATFSQGHGGPGGGSSRPLVLVRNESFTANHSGMHRSQFVFSDANMLECALYLKIGTMMLALSMLENRVFPKIKIANPLGVLHSISETGDIWSANISATRTINGMNETEQKYKTSALELQREYCTRAREFVRDTRFENEELENESMEIILLWEKTLDALYRKDWDWLSGRLDWVTKRTFVEKAARVQTADTSRPLPSLGEIRERVDILYHEVGPYGMGKPLQSISRGKRILTDEIIERAKKHAPAGTRAELRSLLILREMKNLKPTISKINWNNVTTISDNKQYFMDDPLKTTEEWFQELLKNETE